MDLESLWHQDETEGRQETLCPLNSRGWLLPALKETQMSSSHDFSHITEKNYDDQLHYLYQCDDCNLFMCKHATCWQRCGKVHQRQKHSRHFSQGCYQKLPVTFKHRLSRHGKGDKTKLQGQGDYRLAKTTVPNGAWEQREHETHAHREERDGSLKGFFERLLVEAKVRHTWENTRRARGRLSKTKLLQRLLKVTHPDVTKHVWDGECRACVSP